MKAFLNAAQAFMELCLVMGMALAGLVCLPFFLVWDWWTSRKAKGA